MSFVTLWPQIKEVMITNIVYKIEEHVYLMASLSWMEQKMKE